MLLFQNEMLVFALHQRTDHSIKETTPLSLWTNFQTFVVGHADNRSNEAQLLLSAHNISLPGCVLWGVRQSLCLSAILRLNVYLNISNFNNTSLSDA